MGTSADSPPTTTLLPTLLSLTAGSADVVSLLAFGLFNAHITGNLVILAAHVVTGSPASAALLLSVPVFVLVLGLTRLLAAGLESVSVPLLQSLLVLQLALLAGCLAFGVAGGQHGDPNAPYALLAGLLGVSAMAVQNALVQLALKGAPPTAVMTSNITRFTLDVGEILVGRDPAEVVRARSRAKKTWPTLVGFAAGAGLGAVCFAAGSRWSLALPASFALLAVPVSLGLALGRSRV